MANNVLLLDPNDVNINTGVVNGIPQYQDMFIFAELTAKRKARTVLVTTGEGSGYGVEKTGLETDVAVNFIGVNQNSDSPNYLKFTTNYYDGSNGENIQYEGFGMSSIKVSTNSSFVPQVNIQFVDIRGLAFFNRENSPYRILFDFPPPIFDLTIKGYYGKSLTYRLHLVKYTSEFRAENGNFIIDAQFVALTYAPLTDVLLRYAINFPLIKNPISITPTTNLPPRNTFELITKLRNLYTAISDKIKTDADTKTYDSTIGKISQNSASTLVLANFVNDLQKYGNGQPYVLVKDTQSSFNSVSHNNPTQSMLPTYALTNPPLATNEEANISTLNNLLGYDNVIKELSMNGIPKKINKRLYIAYIIGANVSPVLAVDRSRIAAIGNTLTVYRSELLAKTKNAGIIDNDITMPTEFDNNFNVATNKSSTTSTKYVGIDVTDFYIKLYKERIELKNQKTVLTQSINSKINEMIQTKLGMLPTIYNIFKVILDDVDTFFETIRQTSRDAEDKHNTTDFKSLISGSGQYADVDASVGQIYAFPLIINKQEQVCGGFRETRIAPIQLSKIAPFPEIELVENFINTFYSQTKYTVLSNMKTEQNDDGTKKWIPISPFDSVLGSQDSMSPYTGIDTSNGGSQSQPINLSSDDRLTQVLQIVLDRFYVLSQSSIPKSFYSYDPKTSNAYVDLYARSEAVNLAASVTASDYGNNLKTVAENFSKQENMSSFYDYLNKNLPDRYDFTEAEKTYIPVSEDSKAYVDKDNPLYKGVTITTNPIVEQTPTEGSDKPIDTFQKNTRKGLFSNIFLGRLTESYYNFTKENVLLIKDDYVKDGVTKDNKIDKFDGINLETRFIAKLNTTNFGESNKSFTVNDMMNNGNTAFGKYGRFADSEAHSLKTFTNIIDTWIDQLSKYDTEIYTAIISAPSKLSALMFLSNFGYTLSPFNIYPKLLNNLIFSIPAAIEVPAYLPAYIGALVDAFTDGFATEVKDFFLTGSGKNMDSNGYYIFADMHDIDVYLSDTDKQTFKSEFQVFYDQVYPNILTAMKSLYDYVQTSVTEDVKKKNIYNNRLNPIAKGENVGASYPMIILPLIQSSNIINFSEITFKIAIPQTGYQSLKSLNSTTKSTVNNKYFKKFFVELAKEIITKQDDVKKQEDENQKMKGDEDIVTQTYYSFKNVNDKWLSNPVNSEIYGFPFNGSGKKLIDSFVFVDRAMNPIGDTIINPEVLVQMFDDPSISVFSALSQMLSLNGFEFFPLQNFMSYTEGSWKESFEITTGIKDENTPTFVCMFIGGTSSYPTGVQNGFVDDGISDIGNTSASDFRTDENCTPVPENDSQVEKNPDFPWRQIRAFKVRFGTQNQSMFTDIKIDSKEYPETNESIQILSRIAGDNKLQAPIPKGQNLYNLYENRAYKATITGLGNAMIQPTQYFQLENVPLFNGAYIILSVDHDITPNKMVTSFSGTKILRYPVPRVTNPAAIIGFEGGESDETNISSLSAGQVSMGVGSGINADKAKYNSMYEQQIQ